MKLFYLPDLGEGLTDADIQEWYVKEGDTVVVDQPLVSMETAKAVLDVPAPYAGVIEKLFGKAGDTINTGAPLIGFSANQASVDNATVVGNLEISDKILVETISIDEQKQSLSPAKRALARRRGKSVNRNFEKPQDLPGGYQSISRIRRAMLDSMVLAHTTVAAVTISDDADIQAWYGSGDVSLRVIRAMAAACEAEPIMNASFSAKHQAFKMNQHLNMGIAVDTPQGLFMPVLQDVNNKTDTQLREEINYLKEQARHKHFDPSQLQGATIAFSNFGTIAGRYASSIIVPPMVAIVGIGKLRDAVLAIDDEVVIHKIMPISVNLDHCAVTGGEASRFLAAMVAALEKP